MQTNIYILYSKTRLIWHFVIRFTSFSEVPNDNILGYFADPHDG